MSIRRALFMFLLTFALAATGAFARGLPAQAAAPLQEADFTRAASRTTINSGAAASRDCQRGALAWSGCSSDLGYLRRSLQLGSASTGEAFVRPFPGTADDLWSSRLFRPPRLS